MSLKWNTNFKESQFKEKFTVDFKELTEIGSSETFLGPYLVTPSAEKIVLETKSKTMKEDITINPIPFFEVSNTAGGNTIYIGGEIERS